MANHPHPHADVRRRPGQSRDTGTAARRTRRSVGTVPEGAWSAPQSVCLVLLVQEVLLMNFFLEGETACPEAHAR
jgi:hypothetical protein